MSAKEHGRRQARRADAVPVEEACKSLPIRRRRDERFPLDHLATEFLTNVAWLIASAGYPLEEARERFISTCAQIPRHVGRHSRPSPVADPGQVMSLWYSKSEYLTQRGKPIPLPLSGPAPSIEALMHEVDPRLTVSETLDYLSACKAIKRRGKMVIPMTRLLNLPAKSPYQSALHLKAAAGLLRTIDHNANSANQWLQVVAEAPIPEHKLHSTMVYFSRAGSQMAKDADDLLLRRAGEGEKGGANVPLSFGVYVYPGPNEKAARPASSQGNSGQKRKRARGSRSA